MVDLRRCRDAARPRAGRANRLACRSLDEAKVFFTTGGGDAIDTAAKLVRLYWQALGQPERAAHRQPDERLPRHDGLRHVDRRHRGEPGRLRARSCRAPPRCSGTRRTRSGTRSSALGPERVAAFFVEPVIGAGGVLPPARGLHRGGRRDLPRRGRPLRRATRSSAVSAGSARWFGFERFGIEPDLVTFAKGVTSGYLPLGGVVVSGRVAEPFWSEPGRVTVRHGQTYSGHAAVCAAGLANIEILEREGLIPRGQELEGELLATLAPLESHPLVGEVRGGTGCSPPSRSRPDASRRSGSARRRRTVRSAGTGVILRALGRALAVSPPLTISADEMRLIHDAIRAGLDALVDDLVHIA